MPSPEASGEGVPAEEPKDELAERRELKERLDLAREIGKLMEGLKD